MRRIDTGVLVAAAGAVMLLVSLWLHWFEPELSAWETFEVWDIVLAASAVYTLVVAAADLGWWHGPRPGLKLLPVAITVLLVVAVSLINEPPAANGRDLESGAWVALVGAVLMALGAVLSEARISLSFQVDRTSPGRRGRAGDVPDDRATTTVQPAGRAPGAEPPVATPADPAARTQVTPPPFSAREPREPPLR